MSLPRITQNILLFFYCVAVWFGIRWYNTQSDGSALDDSQFANDGCDERTRTFYSWLMWAKFRPIRHVWQPWLATNDVMTVKWHTLIGLFACHRTRSAYVYSVYAHTGMYVYICIYIEIFRYIVSIHIDVLFCCYV